MLLPIDLNLFSFDREIKIWLYLQTVNVYCHNMQRNNPKNSALEYITLNAGPEKNMASFHQSRLMNYDQCSGKEDPTPTLTQNFWGQTW